MRNGTVYAREVKRLFRRLKRTNLSSTWPDSKDFLEHMMVAILSENGSPARAKSALSRLLAHVVDMNDLRVSTPAELARIIDKDLPEALGRTTTLVRVLNGVYENENNVTLQSMKTKNKKEVKSYLEALDGMTPYVAASTMLWGFGHHAIPLDDLMLAALKKDQVIDVEAGLVEAQGFLQRHIPATDARQFVLLLKRYAASKAPRVSSAST